MRLKVKNSMKCETIFLDEEESFVRTLRKRCYCLLYGWGIHEPKAAAAAINSRCFVYLQIFFFLTILLFSGLPNKNNKQITRRSAT